MTTAPPRRIAVIGNAGGGKSTLARRLAAEHDLPYREVDALLWNPDWSRVGDDDYNAAHDKLIAGERWVIDGFGPWISVEARFRRADTIVLVDLPLWVHFWLATERQIAWQKGTLQDGPAGHREPPETRALFEMMWQIDRDAMPQLRQRVDEAEAAGVNVARITSVDELQGFASKPADP